MGSLGAQGWVKEQSPQWEAGGSWRESQVGAVLLKAFPFAFLKVFPFAFQGLSLCFRRASQVKSAALISVH